MKTELLVPDNGKSCPVTHCLSVVGGKWKPVVLFAVSHGVNRFGVLRRAIPDVTKQMLTQQLRELESDGILTRTVFAEIPPRVEYALTDRGHTLLPIVTAMRDWGAADLNAH